jgi:hypothetical protein
MIEMLAMHFRRSNLLRFLLEGFAGLTSGVIYAMRLNGFVMNRRSVWTSMRSLAYLERKVSLESRVRGWQLRAKLA